jgi:hypothetical protein
MRPALALLSLIFLVSLTAAWPGAAAAADSHAAEAPAPDPLAPDPLAPDGAPPPAELEAAADPASSPWEHALWHNATSMMRLYICDHARRPPHWCGEQRDLPAQVPLADPQGPPLVAEDAEWLAFLETVDAANLAPEQIALVRRRAVERRDPQAMEILGYLYAEGVSVERDFAEAYRWYGLAFLAGEKRVRANMDIVWQQLQRHDLESALALTREFDALAQGEVPAGFEAAPRTTPQ